VRCGTIGSLAPLQSAAQIAGIATPATSAMITLASTVLDADIESAGRRLSSIGINANNIDDARRILDSIAGGAR
jgi:opine dehydrogenase